MRESFPAHGERTYLKIRNWNYNAEGENRPSQDGKAGETNGNSQADDQIT